MKISFFLFQNRKKLLIYAIGLIILLTLLYLTILRHSGYIYYWDLSGAFDFRDPFGQYLKLNTNWDGSNIGVRNRLPLVSLIYLIFLPLQALGVSNEFVIKIAIVLLFLGAYTVIYFLAPKLLKLFCKENVEKQGGIYIWSLISGLFYAFIPFYTYRVSQLHLFYMSIFYPLHIYLFLELLNSRKFNWRTIVFFTISMFFGLTSPNIIIFELFTFLVFFIFHILKNIKNLKQVYTPILNLVVAGIFVILTNIYWLLPYFLGGSPDPGYVVSDMMTNLLSQGISVQNFLLGQADWFVNQGNLGVLETQVSDISLIQILGCVVFYGVGIFGLIRYVKKQYIIPFLILLTIAPILVLDWGPYHKELFDTLLYTKLGWIFREINRISFLWHFWFYILFILGSYSIFEGILLQGKFSKFAKILIFPAIFIPFFIYIYTVNSQFFKYLKPVKIDSSIEQVYNLLEEDNDYFSVFYFPQSGAYSVPWLKDKFEIADAEEYKLIAYNSPKPAVHVSNVIPVEKTSQGMLTDYLFEEKEVLNSISHSLANIGVKYVVVRKGAEPVSQDSEYIRAEVIYPTYLYLENSLEFKQVLDNEYYAVFLNNNYRGIVADINNAVYTTSSLNILEHLKPEVVRDKDIVFCNFPENYSRCFEESDRGKTFLTYEEDTYFYLDALSKDEKEEYGYYPYDYTTEQGVNVDWGRASFYEKINGEIHNIFKKYDIHAWNFDLVDKVVYSDNPYIKKEESGESTITFEDKSKCKGNCEVYIYTLFNHIGGNLDISVNGLNKVIDTESNFETYKWLKLGDINLEEFEKVKILVNNSKGFTSIGGILILPSEKVEELKQEVNEYRIIEVSESSIMDKKELGLAESKCNLEMVEYKQGIIPKLTVKSDCLTPTSIYLRNYNSEFLLSPENGNLFTSSFFTKIYATDENMDIWLFGSNDILSLVFYLFATVLLLLMLLVLILL